MRIKTFLLLILVVALGIFIYLKIQTLGSMDSSFNRTTRYDLGAKSWLRTLLSLHKDGDARKWYLIGEGPIAVTVVKAEGTSISDKVLKDFTDQVSEYTGRPTQLFNQEIIKAGKLTQQDLAEIVSAKRRAYLPGQPDLFVIYAEDFDAQPNEVAKTYKEFGIVLSHQKLSELTQGMREAMDEYVQSSLLHEFGHQIGLDHNNRTDCIMNQETEVRHRALGFGEAYTTTKFCDMELDQIRDIKENLQY